MSLNETNIKGFTEMLFPTFQRPVTYITAISHDHCDAVQYRK